MVFWISLDFSSSSCLFIHFHSLGGILLCLHVWRIVLTKFWEMLRDLLGHRHISCMHLFVVAPSTCTGLCSHMLLHVYFKFLSSSLCFIFLFFFYFPIICVLLVAFSLYFDPICLRHVHQKHTPKIPEQRASPMTGSQKKIAIWSKGRRILTNRWKCLIPPVCRWHNHLGLVVMGGVACMSLDGAIQDSEPGSFRTE